MIRFTLAALLCLLLIAPRNVFGASTHSHTPSHSPTSSELHILSWNIYMLPKFAKITGKRVRAKIIADQIKQSDYQILVFQEAFLGDARKIIRKGLKDVFPYEYGPANRKFSIKTNSGIWVLSKLPLNVLEEIDYEQCVGFDDCFARKGALMLEGDFKGQKFQLLGTHLQAGGPHAIRKSQYVEMRNLLDRHRHDDVPQIIAGDMNTGDTDTAHYHDMIQTLDAEDGPLEVQVAPGEKGYKNDLHGHGWRSTRIIDYVFYRGNGRKAAKIERKMPCFKQRWSRKHQDLSDHYPVEFVVEF
jgi:endonuclease/exonuclease/phosphatase family metal-dependent hydrolase